MANNAMSQQASPGNAGSVKGVLRDTVHNYTVKSATVSIYTTDSTLLSYQLSNSYGEFVFKNLPAGAKLYVEVSHVSYELFRKNVDMGAAPGGVIDLKQLTLKPRDILLGEIAIKVPPIMMNGDTLEFNAAAFKLDSNAVVEDLLRKIPNVTLWGDGLITVNGREVKSLLVNGKEFFGGDFKIATQNIAKSALDKVQVYNVQKDKRNPLDSTLTVNLKLKKGKDTGYFGKIGGGYGTDGRFEGDGNLNLFSPKMQLGIVGATNNINKIANDITTLTSNSTFKGSGTNVTYQPDFQTPGISRMRIGGATFNYNFIANPKNNEQNRLGANYFIQDRSNDYISDTRTTTSIGTAGKIFDNNTATSSTLNTNQYFDSKYDLTTQVHRLFVNQRASLSTGTTSSQTLRSAENQQNVPTSTNNTLGQSDFNRRDFQFSTSYTYTNKSYYKQKVKSVNASYSLNTYDHDNERTDVTTFRSFVNAASDRDFNRRYHSSEKTTKQQLTLELPQGRKLFVGDNRLPGFDINLRNELYLDQVNANNQVSDLSGPAGTYATNLYLSNRVRTNTVQEVPSVTISKGFYKGLSNRFDRTLDFRITLRQRVDHQDNRSDLATRTLRRNYSNFAPTAQIAYYRNQYGEHSNQVSLSFNTDVRIPTIDQLAPLTDSTNLYSLQRGNINLKEAVSRSLSLDFYHFDQRGKNTLNYNASAVVVFAEDQIVDSTFIDSQNRRSIYLANANGYTSLNVNGSIRKALIFNDNALQINWSGSASFIKNPSYINNAFAFSKNWNTGTNIVVNYAYKAKLAAETRQTFSYYRSLQEGVNTNYSGTNISTGFSGSYNATSRVTLNSNIAFNSSKPSGTATVNYSIWNASAIYRFLKGSNAEIKLSALDLLRQNNNILNYGSANSFTTGTRNVLRQYFMTTLSYYPRKFGKNQSGK